MTMEYATIRRIKRARREAELNRQRRRAALIAATVIFWLAVCGVFKMNLTEASGSDAITVTVSSGDTLWSLAEKYKPEDKDTREFVRKIASFNEMDGLMIYVGQTVKIPQ